MFPELMKGIVVIMALAFLVSCGGGGGGNDVPESNEDGVS